MNNRHHFLVVALPVQGHINPTLQLAKTLARNGAHVTFTTTMYGLRSMNTLSNLEGLSYASFSDGYDDGATNVDETRMADFQRAWSKNLALLLKRLSEEVRPVTFLIYTVLMPWAAVVAREAHVPSAFLAIQCATALAVYYRLFNSHNGVYKGSSGIDRSITMKLPNLPLLLCDDLPSFLVRKDPLYSFTTNSFREQIKILQEEPDTCVLVNTFDALEPDSIKVMNANMNVIPIGPLLPSAFSDGTDLSDTSFGGDTIRHNTTDYRRWLDTKPEGSVVYVSFGSLVVLKDREKEEMLRGLIGSGRPFLWVIRNIGDAEMTTMTETEGWEEERGLVVPWCSQVEVLFHGSVGCFVTHCGWNSTLESLMAGVPVVVCPHVSDQVTNAKLVEEVWRTGVRAKVDEEGVVRGEDIIGCLDIVMGDGQRGKEIKSNVMKWKDMARKAVKKGGSSHNNLEVFLEMKHR